MALNFYQLDYDRNTNATVRKMLELADEIVTCYKNGDNFNRRRSLERTEEYVKTLELALTGSNSGNFDRRELKNAIRARFPEDFDPIMCEFELAIRRVESCMKGKYIESIGFDHNAAFVDWTLWLFGIVKASAFSEDNKNYLQSNERFFKPEEKNSFTGMKKLFFRNAYRAEMYSHKVCTTVEPDGTYDMYTPLILSRMAVEQYLKWLYAQKISTTFPERISDCKKELEEKRFLSRSLSNEIGAVLRRGNANAHDGDAGYIFSVRHCIAVLKLCFVELKK